MDLTLRVCTYHGEPVNVNGIPTRSGICFEVPITDVINNDIVETPFYNLLDAFEDEWGCKVSVVDDGCIVDINDHMETRPMKQLELDVFEPHWSDEAEASNIAHDLIARVKEWATLPNSY